MLYCFEVAVKLEEALGFLRVRLADEERHVEVADDLRPEFVDGGVASFEPLAALGDALHREVRGVALVVWRVNEAVEVPAVEADLTHLGLRVADEVEVIGVAVLGPVRDEPGELEARGFGGFGGAGERSRSGECEQFATGHWNLQRLRVRANAQAPSRVSSGIAECASIGRVRTVPWV